MPASSSSTLPFGPTFAAAVDPRGYAHVIGRTLAEHADYARCYTDANGLLAVVVAGGGAGLRVVDSSHALAWWGHEDGFDTVCSFARAWNASRGPSDIRAGFAPPRLIANGAGVFV